MTKKKKSILSDQRFIVLLVIIILCAIFSGLSKEFRQYTTILSMLDFSYYDLLMAIGVTFPLITGGVDLSIGTGMVAYALIAGTLIRNNNCPVALAMLICIVLGIAVGALNGVLIGVMNLPPFLATLCTCMITRGAGSLCSATPWPGLTQPGGWFHTIFKVTVGTGRSASRYPLGFLWMIILVLLMEYILNHTKFGRYTIAIGSNKEAAALSGINTKFYHVMVYVVCGLFTGLAAIAYAAVTPTVQPGTGAGLEMDAIGGVFVGGVAATGGYGSVIGTFNSLQAQINPHFLYNTMDMINWMALQGRTDEISHAVQSLSRFYKLTLSRKKGISTIARELEHVAIYVQLQNMRYHDSIELITDIPDELSEYQIPKLTLQPVVENSILHGILEKESKSGTIVITGWMENEDVVLLISDDGVGISPEILSTILSGKGKSQSGGTNIAIYNTHRRLQILYGNDYGLTYSSNPGEGTEVEIRFPAHREK